MSYYEDDDYGQYPPPRQVRVPFLRREVRAGDAIARMTHALGIEPCEPCEERRRRYNQRLSFVPMRRRG